MTEQEAIKQQEASLNVDATSDVEQSVPKRRTLPSTDQLNRSEVDILYALLGGDRNGLGIHRELQRYYSREIDTARIYPNLDRLREKGLIVEIDSTGPERRWTLTGSGHLLLKRRNIWINEMIEAAEQ